MRMWLQKMTLKPLKSFDYTVSMEAQRSCFPSYASLLLLLNLSLARLGIFCDLYSRKQTAKVKCSVDFVDCRSSFCSSNVVLCF